VRIEALMLPDHYYLDEQDECYFAGEYTARKGYAHSATNQLIINFKKSVDKRGTSQWEYKDRAILQAAQIFRTAIKANSDITFVPIPPSKEKTDPLYDDRMLRLLQTICRGWEKIDIRELVIQWQSAEASHTTDCRPSPDDLMMNYIIDEQLVTPPPQTILVIDDVLTTGCHFKAMKQVLLNRFPNTAIIGMFIARRVPEADDLDDFFDLS
jgi:predicted amidophosphoribosyltransferase